VTERPEESKEEMAERRRQQDRDDYNNEMADRDVGRIRRFLPESARGEDTRKRREKEQRQLSALAMLLQNDPEYAALYEDTFDKLRAAEAATETALARARDGLAAANGMLDETLDRASQLPDGTRAFRDADGNVFSEDGQPITGEALDQVRWRDGAPSYEDYLARKKAVTGAQAAYDEILRYQVDVLGHARGRLTDEDNPPTKEELGELQQDIDTQMPDTVRQELTPTSHSEPSAEGTAKIKPLSLGP